MNGLTMLNTTFPSALKQYAKLEGRIVLPHRVTDTSTRKVPAVVFISNPWATDVSSDLAEHFASRGVASFGAKYVLARDSFFENVLNFGTLIFNVSILVHSTLTFAAVDQINLATFKNIHQKLTARCEDGVHLVHIVSSEYPTLVVGSSAGSWYYATIPFTIRRSLLQIPSETEFVWYAVLALVAESEVGADLRMEIENALSKDSQTLVSEMSKGFGKPIKLFRIYRVAALISDSNGLHPTSPLLIQKLSRHVADLTAAEPKGEVLVFKPTERDHLASILKASLKWLLEPRLVLEHFYGTFGCVVRHSRIKFHHASDTVFVQ
ncbi:hypothetical protein HDU77_003239 [Chytriomyces hyalinus]|nr:hypothetical protein HDU77_003239 [Chytriomyces hyalinus]